MNLRAGRGQLLLVGSEGVGAQGLDPTRALSGLQRGRGDQHEERVQSGLVALPRDRTQKVQRGGEGLGRVCRDLQACEQGGRFGSASRLEGFVERLNRIGHALLGQAHAGQDIESPRRALSLLEKLKGFLLGERDIAETQRCFGQFQTVVRGGLAGIDQLLHDLQTSGFFGGEEDVGVGALHLGEARAHLHGRGRVVERFLQLALRDKFFGPLGELQRAPIFHERNRDDRGNGEDSRGRKAENQETAEEAFAPKLAHLLGAQVVLAKGRIAWIWVHCSICPPVWLFLLFGMSGERSAPLHDPRCGARFERQDTKCNSGRWAIP